MRKAEFTAKMGRLTKQPPLAKNVDTPPILAEAASRPTLATNHSYTPTRMAAVDMASLTEFDPAAGVFACPMA